MKRISFLVLLFFFGFVTLFAHPWKPGHFIIIDTDGGMDDFRAISMMLASPDIRVLGITVTPGALQADEAYTKVKSMLKAYHHEGIPVGINYSADIIPAGFPAARNFSWGSETVSPENNIPTAIKVAEYIYSNSGEAIQFVCLGSLNVIKKIQLHVPDFEERTEIIWCCNNFNHEECFNYALDKDAYRKVNRLNAKLTLVDGHSLRGNILPNDFTGKAKNIPGSYARGIARSLQTEHTIFYDEIIALWLHFPHMFEVKISENFEITGLKESLPEGYIQDAFVQIVKGETVNQNQVLNFSWRKEDYFDDIQPIMDSTVIKYGKDEWVAGVMANEMHRHLGIFAIVGTKMGIRAKEFFGAGIDEMKVVSYAGLVPPFSCMNDGLQISTGATVGHGLISISSDTVVRPVAEFSYMGRKIRLTLNPETGKKIASEVKELNSIYGLNSDIYWELVRKLAVKYWATLNRHDIFTIQEIK